jgi:hypothetical protein
VDGRNRKLIHRWWECKLVQPLWKAVWIVPKTLKIKLPFGPVIPVWGIYLNECKSGYNRGTCIPMFTDKLFTIAKLWKQTRCLTTDEWIKEMLSHKE